MPETVYGKVQEEIARDLPDPLGHPVVLVSYMDANVQHDMLTGRSVTGVLNFYAQNLDDWLSKRQACVHTVTFGSDIVAARIEVDQIVDLIALYAT